MLPIIHPIKRASHLLGGHRQLAQRVGVTPGRVSQWINGDRVLADHCMLIERLTEGQVRCEEMRPDLDWAVVRNGQITKHKQAA